MKDYADPSFSQELDDLPNWDRSFWLSRAYMEAGRCLCLDMLKGDFSSQYSSSRVILHLTRHGIELFLKAAIEVAGNRVAKFGHNLDLLCAEYWNLYQDQSFHFSVPPRFKVDPTLDLFPEIAGRFHASLDQRHRYAADKSGESFASPEVFEPKVALKEIEELQRSFGILEWAKIRSQVAQTEGYK